MRGILVREVVFCFFVFEVYKVIEDILIGYVFREVLCIIFLEGWFV